MTLFTNTILDEEGVQRMVERIHISNKLKNWVHNRKKLEDLLELCSSEKERKEIKDKIMYIDLQYIQ